MLHVATKIERLLQKKSSRYTKSKLNFNATTSKEKRNIVMSMHEHNILSSKSSNCKGSHYCNLGTFVEPIITREACINDSEVEEVDDSELKTDILSRRLKSKVILDPTFVSLLQREEKFV